MEVYTTTPLISMMIRTAGSERNNSFSGYHIADPSAARMTILSRRSESMEATRTRGSEGLRRLSDGLRRLGRVPKSDNTVRVMAMNRKTILETDPDTLHTSLFLLHNARVS